MIFLDMDLKLTAHLFPESSYLACFKMVIKSAVIFQSVFNIFIFIIKKYVFISFTV